VRGWEPHPTWAPHVMHPLKSATFHGPWTTGTVGSGPVNGVRSNHGRMTKQNRTS